MVMKNGYYGRIRAQILIFDSKKQFSKTSEILIIIYFIFNLFYFINYNLFIL